MKTSCFGFLIVLALNVLLGGLAVQYDLNVWIPVVAHHSVAAPFWPCAVAGLFLGEIAVPVAILTWILRACGAA